MNEQGVVDEKEKLSLVVIEELFGQFLNWKQFLIHEELLESHFLLFNLQMRRILLVIILKHSFQKLSETTEQGFQVLVDALDGRDGIHLKLLFGLDFGSFGDSSFNLHFSFV